MTATATEREIRSPQNGRVPRLDSPAAPARAGARIPVTVRVRNRVVAARRAGRRWWAWTARPASLAAAWRLSTVDPKRIPGNSGLLRTLWQLSNATDRLAMFALTLTAPTLVQGPLRYIAQRPTRRWAFYLITAALLAAWLLKGE